MKLLDMIDKYDLKKKIGKNYIHFQLVLHHLVLDIIDKKHLLIYNCIGEQLRHPKSYIEASRIASTQSSARRKFTRTIL